MSGKAREKEKPKKKSARGKEGSVAQDQTNRGYYYDDSYGYRNYVPDEEASELEDTPSEDDDSSS